MAKRNFKSAFSPVMNEYIDLKVQAGFDEKGFITALNHFDEFCLSEDIQDISFTKEHNRKWIIRRKGEKSTTHYGRVNKVKNFLIYLKIEGYSVYPGRDIKFTPTDFKPYIYSEQEIERFFMEADRFVSPHNKRNQIQIPVLFRTLLCCGTRISETLAVKKKDVDLEEGLITLRDTKNGEERLIVLNEDMLRVYRRFADKCFYMMSDNDFIFQNEHRKQFCYNSIADIHNELLRRAGIKRTGDETGPHIHSWRHTFAVRSFKQFIDNGFDMHYALPIVSTYLGHKTILATERYVRLTREYYSDIEDKFGEQLDKIFAQEVKKFEE